MGNSGTRFRQLAKLDLDSGPARPPRKALILGPLLVAERIGKDLQAQGFQITLQEREGLSLPALPAFNDPQALKALRAMISDFVSNPSEAAYSHYVHPGVSPWAERPELFTVCQEQGILALCPPARVLGLFGNKLNLLLEAEQVGIPNLALSYDPMYSVREIERFLENRKQAFPLVLKAVRGGGGFGLVVIHGTEDLERKLPLWMEQLRRNTGETMLFAERYLEGARRVVIPFVRLMDGTLEIFPSVDTSLQSRNRKIVEFCPATGIDAEVEMKLHDWTRNMAEACGYVGVGTLEFLVDSSRAYLLEGLARLNSGFHLWEKVADTSAVAWQLAAIEGRESVTELKLKPSQQWACGLALRIFSEDSILQLPQPGLIKEIQAKREWNFPGATAEADLVIAEGKEVPLSGVGLLGMIWVGARDRKQALTVARGVLEESWIAGALQTNERYLLELVCHPWVQEGMFHAGFVDEEFLPTIRPSAEIQLIAASLMSLHPHFANPLHPAGTQIRWSAGDQWVKPDVSRVKWAKAPEFWETGGIPGLSGAVQLEDGSSIRVCAFPIMNHVAALTPQVHEPRVQKWQIRVGQWNLSVRRVLSASPKRGPKLLSLISGRVHSILYRTGAVVPAHEPLMIVESLQQLIPHALPVEVRIGQWNVSAEDPVIGGQELADLEILNKD